MTNNYKKMLKRVLLPLLFIILSFNGVRAQTYLTEDFEGTWTGSPAAPSGWAQTRVELTSIGTAAAAAGTSGPKDWLQNNWTGTAWATHGAFPSTFPVGAQSGSKILSIEDYNFSTTFYGTRRMESPIINLSSSTTPYVRFWYFNNNVATGNPVIRVMASADGGTTWASIMLMGGGFTTTTVGWTAIAVKIPAAYMVANCKIGFEMTSTFGSNNYYLDNLRVEEYTPTIATATTTGNWASAATWGGTLPTPEQDVIINSGVTVTIDGATGAVARCQNLTVNGTLTFSTSTAGVLHAFGNISIASGATLNSFNGTSGRRVYCGGNFTNAGTIGFNQGTSVLSSTTTSSLWWVGGSAATFTNTGTISSGHIRQVVHANPAGVSYANACTISHFCAIDQGVVDITNLTLGLAATTAATGMHVQRSQGSFSAAAPYAVGILNSIAYTGAATTCNYIPQVLNNITMGNEINTISGSRTVTGTGTTTFLINTFGTVTQPFPLVVGNGTTGSVSFTRGILINSTTNYFYINNNTSTGTGGVTPGMLTPAASAGSYATGAIRIKMPSLGATSRTFPLGIGTDYLTTAAPTSNRNCNVILGTASAIWAGQDITISIEPSIAGSSFTSPITLNHGLNTYKIDLNGGADLPATANLTIRGINYTFGNSDNFQGSLVSNLRLIQSPTSSPGAWTDRTISNLFTGSYLPNTPYALTTTNNIAPIATNGAYFTFGTIEAVCAGTPTLGTLVGSYAGCAGQTMALACTSYPSGVGITYAWESAPDVSGSPGTFAAISGANAPTYTSTAGLVAKTWFRVTATCSVSGLSNTSNHIVVQPGSPANCPCTPIYSTGISFGDLISEVKVATTGASPTVLLLNNTGTAVSPNISYTFYNNITPPNLQAGGTYDVTITIGSFNNQGIKAWIDYNDNGVFETPSEVIGNTTAAIMTAFGTGVFPITLACNPSLGIHRMRVREVYANAGPTIDPCSSYGYGETEDYLVNVTTAVPCPNPSAGLATTQTATTATLNWTLGCAETLWDVHVTSLGGGAPAGAPSNPSVTKPYLKTGLTAGTTYEFWVRAVCTVGSVYSAWVGPYIFTTAPANDEASGAITLTPSTSNVCTAATSGTVTSATLSTDPVCSPALGTNNDVWYQFTATNITHIVSVNNPSGFFSFYPCIQMFSGTPGSLTQVGTCAGANFTYPVTGAFTGLTVGVTYYLRVWHFAGSTPTNNFEICVTVPPANDEATGAITITPSTSLSCLTTVSGSNSGATPSAGTTVCSPVIGSGTTNDVWYKFVANNVNMNIGITPNPSGSFGYYPAIQVYTGTPGSLTAFGTCGGASFTNTANLPLSGLTIGTTYYFRTWHNNGGLGTNGFNICVSKAPDPLAYTVTRTPSITYNSIMSSPTAGNFAWQASTSWGFGDENISNVFNMPGGFNFSYQGGLVTGIRVNTNGWISLDATSTFDQSTSGAVFSSILTSTTYDCERMKVAPFAQDLVTTGHVNNVATYTAANISNSIKWDVTGTAPNRIFTVEFAGMELYANPGPNLNYQVKLYETNNKIEFVYGTMEHSNGTSNVFYNWYSGLGSYSPSAAVGQLMGNRDVDYTSYDNLGTGSMNRMPECNSKITFTPGTYVAPVPAVQVVTAPSNDAPAAAATLIVNPVECTSYCGTYYRSNAATASGTPVGTCGTVGNDDDDVWFDITTPAAWGATTTDLAIKVIGTTGYTARIQLMDATMTTTLACGVAAGAGLTATALAPVGTLTTGTLYKVRVYHDAIGSATSGYFSACAYEKAPPPANNECAGATPISSQTGATCTMTTYSTLNTTESQVACSGNADDDVWFSYAALYPTFTINVQSNGTFNGVLEIFNGVCGSLTSVVCVNNTSTGGLETAVLVGATPGTTYYFRVHHFGSGPANGSFGLCINSNPAPANDNCASATPITIGSSCLGTNGNSNYASATPAVANQCAGSTTDDEVWYSFNKPLGTTKFNISVAGSGNYETAYELFSGSCGTLTPVVGGCVNLSAVPLNSTESKLFTGLPSGSTNYYVRVYDYRIGSGSGAHTICVYNANPPANDNPCTSINLSGNTGSIACCPTIKVNFDGGSVYTMGDALPNPTATPPHANNLVYYSGTTSFSGEMVGEPVPSCSVAGWSPARTSWFSFLAPRISMTSVAIRTSYSATTFSTVLAAYAVTTGAVCTTPTFTPIACATGGTLTLTGAMLAPYAGQQIYVQLSGVAGANGNYMYSIHGTANPVTVSNLTTSSARVNIPTIVSLVSGEHISTKIYYRLASSTGYISSPTLAPGATSYTIGGLLSGATYHAWAKYITLSGKEYATTVVPFTTPNGCAGTAPAPTALAQNPLHCAVQTFSWPAHPLAATTYGYRFYNVITGNTNYSVTAVTNPSFGIGALQVNTGYTAFYKVLCTGGASIYSNVITYNTCNGAPKQSNVDENAVYEFNGLEFHNVSYQEMTEATDNTPADGQTHFVKLNLVGNTSEENNTSGVAIAASENSFELVPNPTSNNVLVDYTLNTSNVVVTIKLMDVQGRIIAQYKTTAENTIGAYELNLSEVKAGVYLVNVQADGLNATKKLVVNK
jgi:hypothetical protein